MFRFNHFNFNVLDLQRSLKFYDEALGLKPVRQKQAADDSFTIIFVGDGVSDFTLELTWLRDRTEPYDRENVNIIWLLWLMILMLHTESTRRWGLSASRIRPWESTSLRIRTATGSK